MQFFEYKNGTVTPLSYPMVSGMADERNCFLIWAQDSEDAENAAKEHLAGKPFETLHNFLWRKDIAYRYIENVAVGTLPKEEEI